jgi:hypothetical protein
MPPYELRTGEKKANKWQKWELSVLLLATCSWDIIVGDRFFADAQLTPLSLPPFLQM